MYMINNIEVTTKVYAEIMLYDVKQSFSKYKKILKSNRRLINFKNLKHFAIVSCNTFE